DDKSCHLHRGTKVRKMHTSRRDTFKSINTTPIAEIKDNKIRILREDYKKRGLEELQVRDKIEPRVALIKTYPGINPEIIEYYIDKNYKGIVIEGTGLGHCPENLIPAIERANEMEIIVAMASQCINGRVNMNVYSTGRRLLRAGVIPVADMLPETAYVKLVWALGQSNDPETVKRLMVKNIAGEIEDRSSLRHFQG
ncbi:MAG: type I asparaginase, partial [Methanobacteriaceae archaeon]|nr:type I asparaginase [Methanobacteriaceae archaeon]